MKRQRQRESNRNCYEDTDCFAVSVFLEKRKKEDAMNHTAKFKGVLTAREEFLYPDSPVYDMPGQLYTATAKNGQKGLQLLLQTNGK